MKKNLIVLSLMLVLLLCALPGVAQLKDITWTTKSETAKKLAIKGAGCMVNFEYALAYDFFKQSLELDPDFTIPLIFMTTLTKGKTQKDYFEMATKSSTTKTEGEKLLASTIVPDIKEGTYRKTWSELYDKFPDNNVIGAYYVISRPSAKQQFIAAQDYIKKFPLAPCMYNIIGFLYLDVKKDTAMAKSSLEKYIELYPEGCNPYDSMGEFYFIIGDMTNSEKFYNMALEKYPFNISSINKLKEIKVIKEKSK
jgi:tetratricopeptide (TPR) repeat protein